MVGSTPKQPGTVTPTADADVVPTSGTASRAAPTVRPARRRTGPNMDTAPSWVGTVDAEVGPGRRARRARLLGWGPGLRDGDGDAAAPVSASRTYRTVGRSNAHPAAKAAVQTTASTGVFGPSSPTVAA